MRHGVLMKVHLNLRLWLRSKAVGRKGMSAPFMSQFFSCIGEVGVARLRFVVFPEGYRLKSCCRLYTP